MVKKLDLQKSVGALDEEGALADPLAEIVQLGTANLAFVGDFDFRNPGGVEGENPLDAFAIRNFAHRESGIHAGTTASQYDPSKNLDAFFAAFNNAAVHLHGVSDIELGNVLFQLL
jgi:hypothetical protein